MSSRTWSNVPIGLTAIAGLLVAAGPAAAAESVQGQKLLIQALVGDVCTVTSATLEFPPYDSANGVSATGEILIDCVAETTLGVRLDGGMNQHNGGGQRTMKHAASDSNLLYLLRKDLAGNAWETDETVTTTITDGAVPVYGSVPPSQAPGASGLYTDEITITLVF